MNLCFAKILVTSYNRLVPVKYGASNGLIAGAVLGLVPKCLVSLEGGFGGPGGGVQGIPRAPLVPLTQVMPRTDPQSKGQAI